MNIEIEEINDVAVAVFNGKLNTGTSPAAEDEMNSIREQGFTKILLDFNNLDYISSTGLRVVLHTGKQLAKVGGELRLCGFNETVKEIFDMSGFSAMFKVFTSRDEALNGF